MLVGNTVQYKRFRLHCHQAHLPQDPQQQVQVSVHPEHQHCRQVLVQRVHLRSLVVLGPQAMQMVSGRWLWGVRYLQRLSAKTRSSVTRRVFTKASELTRSLGNQRCDHCATASGAHRARSFQPTRAGSIVPYKPSAQHAHQAHPRALHQQRHQL